MRIVEKDQRCAQPPQYIPHAVLKLPHGIVAAVLHYAIDAWTEMNGFKTTRYICFNMCCFGPSVRSATDSVWMQRPTPPGMLAESLHELGEKDAEAKSTPSICALAREKEVRQAFMVTRRRPTSTYYSIACCMRPNGLPTQSYYAAPLVFNNEPLSAVNKMGAVVCT
jgi:(2Fe-2S) ferredoxin